jgi:hypothetical protein
MLRIKTAKQFVEEMERTHYLQKTCKPDGVPVKSVLQNRPVPESHADLVEFFLSTESQEINFEIARYRPRLQDDFFSHLKSEIGSLRFAVNHTQVT